jgi:hypothetical protein
MVVLVIILSIVSIFLGATIIALSLNISNLKMKNAKFAEYLISMIEDPEIYPCELLVCVKFNQSQESMITDFSRYDEYKQIGIIIQETRPPSTEKEEATDGQIICYPQSVVFKVGDSWSWKFG